ncbi:ABC transporter ATP-binding protein [Lacrimispora sp. NSJ-141]|uniref:ABC transporter ATP-binding protein n=1 Tax=Lientehia hominis TaxID=2897778 RepID=A0AAP2RKY5_9FIRM|nr:ATP-binding cassette domain-containing protein [Lientehia hominis]MCD2493519.1 ABC transporter ATP-binding protein [Lientehia hominis]
MIEVKNLVKKYGGHLAVDNLNFTVEKGQIYGFLGPNGAGKSTTMNIITGYIASTEGTVTVDGHDILEEPEAAKKCIGYLPEQPPLYFDMTVAEYLNFAAELKQVEKPKRKEMIQEVMEMTGITDVGGRVIKNLSKGYRQRVGLAQALIGFPEILILDEPTVGLDPKQMIEIRELIKSLSKNHTVILSSHILSEVSAVCDYIMIISKGKLVASDTPENLSKEMAGAQKLSLLVKGSPQEVESAVGNIHQVSSFCCEESEQEGVLKVSLEAEPEADVREEIFFAMADRKLPILELMTTSMSLEDVFLELTEGGEEPEGEEKGRRKSMFGTRLKKTPEEELEEEEENHAGNL